MKTIKVFLASSEELKDEREKFGNLIRRLDDIYLKRGIRVKLLVWEDLDPSYYENVRKQDEYNAWIRECDIFVCLFYTRAGQYTLEELDVAKQENARRHEPKLLIYCRDLQPNEVERKELAEFKKSLEHELKHFAGHYATTDKLHLDFVMFFMRSAEGNSDALIVENGHIVFDGFSIACMDNLPFVADNEGYQKMKEELEALPAKIERMRKHVEKYPDEKDFSEELQMLLNRYNDLQKEFARHQQNLLATVKRISDMQQEKVNSELQNAIKKFEEGHVEAANTILDCIEREADRHMEQLDRDRALVHHDIDALLLKVKTLMAVPSIPIQQRIDNVLATYQKAYSWSQRSALEKTKLAVLLYDYGKFLYDYSMYNQALSIWLEECRLNEELYGVKHPKTAKSYNIIGYVYYRQDALDQALKYHQKALAIRESLLGIEHPDTATSYNNISLVYYDQRDYDHALEYQQKALAIREKVLGTEHQYTATSYNNIGKVYYGQRNYTQALYYYQKALTVREKVLGSEHPDTAKTYNNIGKVYYCQHDYAQAMNFYNNALKVFENVLGVEHVYTAKTYSNIAEVYRSQGNNVQALENYQKTLAIFEKVLSKDHSSTQNVRESIEAIQSEMASNNS